MPQSAIIYRHTYRRYSYVISQNNSIFSALCFMGGSALFLYLRGVIYVGRLCIFIVIWRLYVRLYWLKNSVSSVQLGILYMDRKFSWFGCRLFDPVYVSDKLFSYCNDHIWDSCYYNYVCSGKNNEFSFKPRSFFNIR